MGAVDFVPKPASRDSVTSVASELCQKVIQASKARLRIGEPLRRHEKERAKRRKSSAGEETSVSYTHLDVYKRQQMNNLVNTGLRLSRIWLIRW